MNQTHHPRAAWPSRDDETLFYSIVCLLGGGFLLYLFWTYQHRIISEVFLQLQHGKIRVIDLVSTTFDPLDREIAVTDPADVTLAGLREVAHDIGLAIRLPVVIFIGLLAIACSLYAAPSMFRRKFTLDSLLAEHARAFRVTATFVRRKTGLVKPGQPLRPADCALTAREWIERYATHENAFNTAMARCALIRQLGPRWRGVTRAEPHVRCLFVAFATHRREERQEALSLLGELAEAFAQREDCSSGPPRPLRLPAAVVAKFDSLLTRDRLAAFGKSLSIAARHAYTHTAMMTVLNEARLHAGVLAPAQFAWLKLVDRPLWYALNALGFESEGYERYLHPNSRAEAVGACDHWEAERIAGEPLRVPHQEQALQALQASAERQALKRAARTSRRGATGDEEGEADLVDPRAETPMPMPAPVASARATTSPGPI